MRGARRDAGIAATQREALAKSARAAHFRVTIEAGGNFGPEGGGKAETDLLLADELRVAELGTCFLVGLREGQRETYRGRELLLLLALIPFLGRVVSQRVREVEARQDRPLRF